MDMAFSSSSYIACIKTVSTARCLVKRLLTLDHSGFEASCHNIVICIPIARQRFGKHIPATRARNNRTSIAR
jgi:hypothetical protein